VLLVRAIVRAYDADRLIAAEPGLIAVLHGGVGALASRCHSAPRPTEPELRAHEAITRRIHDRAASLPSRFGQAFSDEDALRAALTRRGGDLVDALDEVGGRVELALTLSWRSKRGGPPAPPAESGRAYLEAGAARERDRAAAQRIAEELVGELACEPAGQPAHLRLRVCPREGVAAIVEVLTDRPNVPALRSRAEAFGDRSSDVLATVHGPMPPYSFAS
jgi:hypothetical protein